MENLDIKIHAIKIGDFSVRFKGFGGIPSFDNIPCYVFLILEKNKAPVLVDTGFSKDHVPGVGSSCTQEKTLEESLKELGFLPDDIKKVILTHLHWDHTGNLHLFKKADIYVNKEEITGLLHLMPNEETYFVPMHFMDMMDKFILTDNNYEISENICLCKTGYHTYGHQVVKIKTNNRTVVLAGDAPFSYADLWKQIPQSAWQLYKKSEGSKFYWEDEVCFGIEHFLEDRHIENIKPPEQGLPKFKKGENWVIGHDPMIFKKKYLF